MRNLFVVLVIVFFGLFAFTSCDIPNEIKKKYKIENNNGGEKNNIESGKDEEPDPDNRSQN